MTNHDVEPIFGLDPQIGLLAACLEQATQEWRKELESLNLPDEAYWYQPDAGGHSIGAIMLHLADVEAFWIYEFVCGHERTQEEWSRLLSKETDQYGGNWPVPPAVGKEWYHQQMDDIRARTRTVLAEITDPTQVRPRRNYTVTDRWVMNHVVIHEAYHGGQAVLIGMQWQRRKGKLAA